MNSNLLLHRVVVKFKSVNNARKAPCITACQRKILSKIHALPPCSLKVLSLISVLQEFYKETGKTEMGERL